MASGVALADDSAIAGSIFGRPGLTSESRFGISQARPRKATAQSANVFGLKLVSSSTGGISVLNDPVNSYANRQSEDDVNDEPPAEYQEKNDSVYNGPPVLMQLDGATPGDLLKKLSDGVVHEPSGRTSLGWIAGSNDQLGMLELDFDSLPRMKYDPYRTGTFFLDNSFGAKWLNGPGITDLPPYLFNLSISVGAAFQVTEQLRIEALLSPSWYTDFSNKGIEAFRLPWHLVSYYRMVNDWHFVLGVTDLARDDIHYLPVVGLSYVSAENPIEWDLVFPRPRVAWKVHESDEVTHLLYLSGELGGGSWAISRENRSYDVVTYRDYRMMAGLETRLPQGVASRIELGWVFNRAVEYRSNIGNYSPSDSLMLRISQDY